MISAERESFRSLRGGTSKEPDNDIKEGAVM